MSYVPRLSQVTPTQIWRNPYWYGPTNGFNSRGNGLPNCTCYAYGRWTELNNGIPVHGLTKSGNGGSWYDMSAQSLRAGNDARTVQLGDILVFAPTSNAHPAGHVSVVEEVNLTASRPYVKVSESGYRRPLSSYPPNMSWYFHVGTHYIDDNFRDGWIRSYGYYLKGMLRFLNNPGSPSYPIPASWVSKSYLYSMNEEDRQNNAILIYSYLTTKGWTLEAIAGFLGNVEVESNISPGCWGLGGANAFGLVMWTPSSNYIPWARANGYDDDDGNAQLDFIDMGVYCYRGDPNDLRNTWTPNNHGINTTYAQFKAGHKTPEEMAYIFLWGYERAAGDGMIAARQRNAKKWYQFLQGIDVNAIGPFITESQAEEITRTNMPVWMLTGNEKPKYMY